MSRTNLRSLNQPFWRYFPLVLALLVGACASKTTDSSPVASLVASRTEPAGVNCPAGGVAIDVGEDLDGDGVLELEEVNRTEYVCNGEGGEPGTLVTTRTEDAGENCENGGVAIDVGQDLDGDGVLDFDEVTSTSYACHGDTGPAGSGASLVALHIDPVSEPVVVPNTVQLTAVGYFDDARLYGMTTHVDWSTSDAALAAVSVTGLVTSVGAGTVTVTATEPSSGISTTIDIDVVSLDNITLEGAPSSLYVGDEKQLGATGHYSDGSSKDLTDALDWESSHESLCTVSASGFVQVLDVGVVTITATHAETGVFANVEITIGAVPPDPGPAVSDSLVIHPAEPLIGVDELLQMIALGRTDAGDLVGSLDALEWEVDDTEIASIDATGLLTPVSTGTVVVTATFTPSGTGTPESTTTTVQIRSGMVGGRTHADWTSSEILSYFSAGHFIHTLDGSVPLGADPFIEAGYTELSPPAAGVQITTRSEYDFEQNRYDMTVTIGFIGSVPGRYDVTTDAFALAETFAPIAQTLAAGPTTDGSSGRVVVTRYDADGGRVEGYYDMTICSSVFGCILRTQGAFSVTRSADRLLVDEGSTASPIPLTEAVTHPGVVTTSSFYSAVITDAAAHEVRVDNASGDIDIAVYSDASFSTLLCDSVTNGSGEESCTFFADSGLTEVFVRVDYNDVGPGATYDILVSDALFSADGSSSSPVVLENGMIDPPMAEYFYAGQVNHEQSYYTASVNEGDGLWLTLYLSEEPSGVPTVTVYTGPTFSISICDGIYDGFGLVECEGFVPTGIENVYVVVDGSGLTSFGVSYDLGVSLISNEGSLSDPLSVATGQANQGGVGEGPSYYVAEVTAGLDYTVELSSPSDDVSLTVYSDAFTTVLCTSDEPDRSNESCTITAPGPQLFFEVGGSNTDHGAMFNRFVYRHFTSEGTVATPVILSPDVVHAGAVSSAGTASYYAVTFATAGPHNVAVLPLVGSVVYQVYSDSSMEGPLCEVYTANQELSDCWISTGYESIFIVVNSSFGSSFNIDATEGFYEDAFGPTLVVDGGPITSTVHRATSEFGGDLVVGERHRFSLTHLVANADLVVYNQWSEELCRSDNAGTADEVCEFVAIDFWNQFVAVVEGDETFAGTSFNIEAVILPIEPEGTAGAPISIAPFTWYQGQVDASQSFYRVAGLTPDLRYEIVLSPYAQVASMTVYSDAFTTVECSAAVNPLQDGFCRVVAPASGELYIEVHESFDPGTHFMLGLFGLPDFSVALDNIVEFEAATLDITFTVTNSGPQDWALELTGTNQIDLVFYPDAASAPVCGDPGGAAFAVEMDVAANGGQASTTVALASDALTSGTAYLIVDCPETIPEANETNNVSSGSAWSL